MAQEAIDRFEELGLIDDEAFASAWIDARLRTRNSSRRALHAELRAKGIAEDIAEDALAVVDENAELQGARAVAEKFVRALPEPIDLSQADRRRLFGRLARRGFAADVVRQVLAEYSSDD